jgi:hypothetical protein
LAQTLEVDVGDRAPIHVQFRRADLAVVQRREALPQAQLVEQAHGGRMHRVTAKVTQEVAVLLQQGHIHTGSSQ